LLLLLALVILGACQQAPITPDPTLFKTPDTPYGFLWDDPLVATVVTTPPQQRAALPEQVPVSIRRVNVPDTPPVPPALWYQHGMPYALAAQPGPAPLVFIIAGTGGNATSKTTTTLTRVLYASGYHVLAVPSPTHADFMVNASSTGVPGRLQQDARDLYRAMKLAYDDVRDDIDITGTRLTGYSLGGWHAAFVAYLDAEYDDFGFERVLLLNPPVSLYRSMTILDNMLVDNIEGGIDGVPAFADRVLAQLSRLYAESAQMGDFSGNFLYAAYLQLKPTDQALAALVGMVFRLIAVDTVMTADLVSREGTIVTASAEPTWFTPLSPYWPPSVREGFTGYLDNLLLPYFRRQDPGLSRETLVHEATLERIEPFLAESEKIYMITNADDIILADGDVAWLTRVFGDRATVFPHGGHCGNYEYPHVVAAINQALAPEAAAAPASSSGAAVTP
jgi:hypothetical protein